MRILKPKFNLTRRWVRARPGSVLILVIALLVLLALIGTAYLSSTQTERYSAVQNDINTEADLLIQGLQVAVNGAIANGLFGNGPAGQQYRPPTQEMPTYTGGTQVPPPVPTYHNYDSTAVDPNLALGETVPGLFMSGRIPVITTAGVPAWDSISWPLFADSSGNYNFDSPFEDSVSTFLALNKGKIQVAPWYRTIDGKIYPAMALWVPSPNSNVTLQTTSGATGAATAPGQYITPQGFQSQPYFYVAASASGDGITDAGLCKLPIGQINGITYYYAYRVVDGNSAINVSSAMTQGNDAAAQSGGAGGESPTNYGFFRSNIGLWELFDGGSTSTEMTALNNYRFPFAFAPAPIGNFSWYSQADQMEHLLTSRPGNPAYGLWLGQSVTAALAYRYSLINPNSSPNPLETPVLPAELYNANLRNTPWSANQVGNQTSPGTWYYNNFLNFNGFNGSNTTGTTPASPLRTLLVGNNAVSNTAPSWYGNTSSSTPTVWTAGVSYKFGDWVVDGPAGHRRSFVCIRQHTAILGVGPADGSGGNQPEPNPDANANGYNPGAVPFWAGAEPVAQTDNVPPGVPWSAVPVKTSINTATFEELWLGFAQVMTDSVGFDPGTSSGTPQWQPPMQWSPAATGEPQLPQFRSTLRDTIPAGTAGRKQLTSSQMLRLRAAIAAINTIDLRGGTFTDYTTNPGVNTHVVTSKRIVLTDANGNQQYEVEIFGNKPQPYISEMVAQVDTQTTKNYVAIELVNPYPFPINMTNWAICTVDRKNFVNVTGMQMDPPLAMDPSTPVITVPASTTVAGVTTPGIAVVASSNSPPPGVTPPAANLFLCPTLVNAIGKELVFVRPRYFGTTAGGIINPLTDNSANATDPYKEDPTTALGCADMVPVDQMDLTGADQIDPKILPVRLQYRRGSLPSATSGGLSYAWNFVYPGPYDPTLPAGTMRMGGIVIESGVNTTSGNLGQPDAGPPVIGSPTSTTYKTAPVQICNEFMAGPKPMNQSNATLKKEYPFGQFTRNADMLQVPFIGAYRIRALSPPLATGFFTELNSITMDSTLSLDTTMPALEKPDQITGVAAMPSADCEQIGRFCPVGDPSATTPDLQLDFGPGFASGDPKHQTVYWHYHWAKKLFDYFTVQSPQDDYYPNVDPAKYPDPIIPAPVANYNSTIANAFVAGTSEDTVGVEGLININTAPVAVLAQLPFTAADTANFSTPAAQVTANAAIAQAIVDDRTLNGPFKSIFDLYRVKKFRDENTQLLATDPGPAQGDFSPGGIGTAASQAAVTDGVRYDFKERFLLLNNISNLITTRSDTFTCYVLLQGWRNVGTGHPTLSVERRASFLVDRNTVTPANNQPISFKIPN